MLKADPNVVLLFVFWYCHKRGRETRLEREKTADAGLATPDIEDEDESDANDTAVEESAVLEGNSDRAALDVDKLEADTVKRFEGGGG